MTKISSGFMGSFKMGDNINYNLVILKKLYCYYNDENEEEPELLLKPIIILIIAIIEALLKDYFDRIYGFTKEGVAGMIEEKLKEIRKKKYEDFNTFISGSKKHNLFKEGDLFYSELDYLRRIRNYIHITGTRDEGFIFTADEKKKAEGYCKHIMNYLSDNHMRDGNKRHVEDFDLPW